MNETMQEEILSRLFSQMNIIRLDWETRLPLLQLENFNLWLKHCLENPDNDLRSIPNKGVVWRAMLETKLTIYRFHEAKRKEIENRNQSPDPGDISTQ